MRASLQYSVERVTAARLRRGQPLATAIDSALSRTSADVPLICRAALALALGFSTPVEAGNTFTVNTAGDPGPGGTLSLRQAIALANASGGNTVQFDPSLAGSTITLASGEIATNKLMYIVGLGVGRTTISGNDASAIFYAGDCSGIVNIKHMRLTHGKGGSGGAIRALSCSLNIIDVDVTASQATVQGGGMYAFDSNVTIDSSSITGNSAAYGGGISGFQSLIAIGRSTISGNQATYRGGGIYVKHASYANIYYSTVSGNFIPQITGPYFAPVGGGAAMLVGSKLNAGNTTIAYNYAFTGGGGLRLYDAYSSTSANIYSSTIAGNSTCCYDGGNGILSTGGTTKFALTIVANNFNRGGYDDLAGSFSIDRSLVRSTGSASLIGTDSLVGVDPRLGSLGVNGGFMLTMLPAADSPAIDATGDCSVAKTVYDQRGVIRCVNGHVDMGAVERQIPEVVIFRNGFDPGG